MSELDEKMNKFLVAQAYNAKIHEKRNEIYMQHEAEAIAGDWDKANALLKILDFEEYQFKEYE